MEANGLVLSNFLTFDSLGVCSKSFYVSKVIAFFKKHQTRVYNCCLALKISPVFLFICVHPLHEFRIASLIMLSYVAT